MKHSYFPISKMLVNFDLFIEKNKAQLETTPLIWENVSLVQKLRPQFEAANEVRFQDISGFTKTKSLKKQEAAISLNTINLLLYNYCIKTHQLDDIENFKGSVVQFMHKSNKELIEAIKFTLNYLNQMGNTKTDAGVSPEHEADLIANKEAFMTYIPLPKNKREYAKREYQVAKTLAKQIKNIFKNRLNKTMKAYYEFSHPELYAAYKDATKIDTKNSRKLAVMGKILNEENLTPIARVNFTIPEVNFKHTSNGKAGGFRIRKLEPGTYQMKVSATNFETQTLTLVHNEDETTVLDLLLKPLHLN